MNINNLTKKVLTIIFKANMFYKRLPHYDVYVLLLITILMITTNNIVSISTIIIIAGVRIIYETNPITKLWDINDEEIIDK